MAGTSIFWWTKYRETVLGISGTSCLVMVSVIIPEGLMTLLWRRVVDVAIAVPKTPTGKSSRCSRKN